MNFSHIAGIVASIALLSSCSLLNNITATSGDKKSSAPDINITTVNAPKKDKKKKKDTTTAPVINSPKGERLDIAELTEAQWQIQSVADNKIEAEDDAPYIIFESSSSRFYASDGCNIINGDYVLRSDGKLLLSNTMSTMKYCADTPLASAITMALSSQEPYTAEFYRIGQESYIYLKNAAGKTALTLRRHNMEFLNGNWQVTAIDGTNIDDEECNIFIDIAELKIHGNTGCNYFNGTLYIDPERSNAIDFSNMGVTRMACPKTKQETAMLVALEQAATAIAGKNDKTVLILDAKGKQVLTLKRIPLPEQE